MTPWWLSLPEAQATIDCGEQTHRLRWQQGDLQAVEPRGHRSRANARSARRPALRMRRCPRRMGPPRKRPASARARKPRANRSPRHPSRSGSIPKCAHRPPTETRAIAPGETCVRRDCLPCHPRRPGRDPPICGPNRAGGRASETVQPRRRSAGKARRHSRIRVGHPSRATRCDPPNRTCTASCRPVWPRHRRRAQLARRARPRDRAAHDRKRRHPNARRRRPGTTPCRVAVPVACRHLREGPRHRLGTILPHSNNHRRPALDSLDDHARPRSRSAHDRPTTSLGVAHKQARSRP